MSSNTIALTCKSCQKDMSNNIRRHQRPSHVEEEDYYTKYHSKQRYSAYRKETTNYPINIYRQATISPTSLRLESRFLPNYNNSNNNDQNKHVCMSCSNH